MPRQAKVCNLKSPAVVDEQVGGFHVAVEDVVVVQVTEAFEELQHVALDLGRREVYVGIIEQARQVVVHVGHDHVEDGALPALCLGALDGHLFQLQDVFVGEHLEQLDLAQRCDGEAVLLVVGEDLLHGEDAPGADVSRLVDFAKSALAQLLEQLILADLGAALEAALQALGGRRGASVRHGGQGWVVRRARTGADADAGGACQGAGRRRTMGGALQPGGCAGGLAEGVENARARAWQALPWGMSSRGRCYCAGIIGASEVQPGRECEGDGEGRGRS